MGPSTLLDKVVELYESLAITRLFSIKARGSALKRLPFWRRATRTGDPLESSLWLLGLVDMEPRAAQKGCRSRLGFLDTPGDSSYIVLGRYFGTVVAWARHLDLK